MEYMGTSGQKCVQYRLHLLKKHFCQCDAKIQHSLSKIAAFIRLEIQVSRNITIYTLGALRQLPWQYYIIIRNMDLLLAQIENQTACFPKDRPITIK